MNPYNNPYVTKLKFRMMEDTDITMDLMAVDNSLMAISTTPDTINHMAQGQATITMGKEVMDIIIRISQVQMIVVLVWLLRAVPAAFLVAASDDCIEY